MMKNATVHGENERTLEKVTAKDLQNYYFVLKNIEMLEAERAALQNTVKSPNGHEHIGGKSSSRSASSPTEAAVWKMMSLDEKLQAEAIRLQELRERIEKWLSGCDPEIALIVRVHYFNRQTWRRTCELVYGYPDKDYPRKKLARYLNGD